MKPKIEQPGQIANRLNISPVFFFACFPVPFICKSMCRQILFDDLCPAFYGLTESQAERNVGR